MEAGLQGAMFDLRKAEGMNSYLFLDFDGVLNSESYFEQFEDRECKRNENLIMWIIISLVALACIFIGTPIYWGVGDYLKESAARDLLYKCCKSKVCPDCGARNLIVSELRMTCSKCRGYNAVPQAVIDERIEEALKQSKIDEVLGDKW